jgi:hypothetical protein
MKSKIYFAKSNKANPDHIILVREILARFDVEVVEYKGGSYSHKPLLECDMLVVLPDLTECKDLNEEEVGLGKGLYDQIKAFKSTSRNKCDTYIINYVHEGSKEVGYGDVHEIDCADPDDYINHAVVLFNTDDDAQHGQLGATLEDRLGFNTSTPSRINKSRYKYLLASK